MTNFFQCSRCKNVWIAEEYENHLCTPRVTEFKTAKFTSYYIAEQPDGKKIIDLTTLDGISYTFEEVPENKEYTKIPYQPRVNTENTNHEDNSTDFIFTTNITFFLEIRGHKRTDPMRWPSRWDLFFWQ